LLKRTVPSEIGIITLGLLDASPKTDNSETEAVKLMTCCCFMTLRAERMKQKRKHDDIYIHTSINVQNFSLKHKS